MQGDVEPVEPAYPGSSGGTAYCCFAGSACGGMDGSGGMARSQGNDARIASSGDGVRSHGADTDPLRT